MSVKCDIKQYPSFNGKYAKWPKYKRDIIALASTHGLDNVFDPKFNVPVPSDPDFNIFQEKNRSVYSVFISRVTGGLVLLVICNFEDHKDGRGIYMKFRDIYECASNP